MFGHDIFAIQLNFIIRRIVLRLNASIVSLFFKFLGIVEIFLANNYQLF